ncbi:MAG TPA: prolyl oligopeptidase family serine peptidase [Trebonia sp.]
MSHLTLTGPGLPGPAPAQAGPLDKITEAQLRAAPLERLLDYGLVASDALFLRGQVAQGSSWSDAGLRVTNAHLAASDEADRAGLAEAQRQHLLSAAVTASVAQLMMAGDDEQRRDIYRLSVSARDRWLAGQGDRAGRLAAPGAVGELDVIWLRPAGAARTAVVALWGGTSGWGIAYRRCAQALLDAGLSVALVELPGQGSPRLLRGKVLGPGLYATARCLIEALRSAPFSTGHVGIWGQSVGGLLAAQVASHLPEVSACCVTSGPGTLARAVQQSSRQRQLWADMLGRPAGTTGLGAEFDFAAGQRIGCPVLVVHGGRDPLVTDAESAAFAAAGAEPSRLVVWPDEGHCVYGRAQERDVLVAAWFRSVLSRPA